MEKLFHAVKAIRKTMLTLIIACHFNLDNNKNYY